MFSLYYDDDSKVDFEKPLGLIYYKGEKIKYFEIKENKYYKTYEDLFSSFRETCYYGVGNKKSIK